jgi:hypothetical protein
MQWKGLLVSQRSKIDRRRREVPAMTNAWALGALR